MVFVETLNRSSLDEIRASFGMGFILGLYLPGPDEQTQTNTHALQTCLPYHIPTFYFIGVYNMHGEAQQQSQQYISGRPLGPSQPYLALTSVALFNVDRQLICLYDNLFFSLFVKALLSIQDLLGKSTIWVNNAVKT